MSLAAPIRLQLSRVKGFDLQLISMAANGRTAIVCRRPAKWGNRGHIVERLGCWCCDDLYLGFTSIWQHDAEARDAAIAAFRRHAMPREAEIRAELAGFNLACTCALDEPCHVDVLLEIANR